MSAPQLETDRIAPSPTGFTVFFKTATPDQIGRATTMLITKGLGCVANRRSVSVTTNETNQRSIWNELSSLFMPEVPYTARVMHEVRNRYNLSIDPPFTGFYFFGNPEEEALKWITQRLRRLLDSDYIIYQIKEQQWRPTPYVILLYDTAVAKFRSLKNERQREILRGVNVAI